MTNTIALVLAVLILGFVAVDATSFGWELSTFLGKKLAELIEYLAFWR